MKNSLITIVLCVSLLVSLTSCAAKLQGQVKDDIYHSPKKAYSLALNNVIFRGEVKVEERCDQTGGSTTFFDQMNREFKIDYLVIDENYLARVPVFASDETLLNGVFNTYVKEVIAPMEVVQSTDIVHRETYNQFGFTTVYSLVEVDFEPVTRKQKRKNMDGIHYYGVLTFRRGDFVYVVLHKQKLKLVEQSKDVLNAFFREMQIPGKQRKESAGELSRRYINNTFSFLPNIERYEKYSQRVCE